MKKIALTQNQFALVDDEDFEYLNQWKWYAHKARKGNFYATRTDHSFKKSQTVTMHKLLVECPLGKQVDHADGNGLNNQRSNLRICTLSQNQYNQRARNTKKTSKFKGIYWNKRGQKWWVQIRANHKTVFVGKFAEEIEAARAYDTKAKELHGEFAVLNFK